MTHDYTDMWHLLQSTYRSIFMARRKVNPAPPPIPEILAQFPLEKATPGDIFPLFYMMQNYNREALSTNDYRIRNCYDNPAVIEEQLKRLAADGFLETDNDIFRVTDKGVELYHFVLKLLRPRWIIPPLEMDAEIDQIIARMKQLVDVTFATTAPPANWSMTKRRDTGISIAPDAHPLEYFEWHIYDLWSYRDDSHLAAWHQYDVSPFAWEALTYIWNNEVNSAATLAEKLSTREYSTEQWATYVQELIDRDWVTVADEKYGLTTTGKSVRDEAEKLTDSYFYAHWQKVPHTDIDELRSLLQALQTKAHAVASG